MSLRDARGGEAARRLDMRHRWQEVARFDHATHRACSRCGLARVTVRTTAPAHVPGIRDRAGNLVSTEFWKDGEQLDAMPACAAVEEATT